MKNIMYPDQLASTDLDLQFSKENLEVNQYVVSFCAIFFMYIQFVTYRLLLSNISLFQL